jgi:hypothetical protein
MRQHCYYLSGKTNEGGSGEETDRYDSWFIGKPEFAKKNEENSFFLSMIDL